MLWFGNAVILLNSSLLQLIPAVELNSEGIAVKCENMEESAEEVKTLQSDAIQGYCKFSYAHLPYMVGLTLILFFSLPHLLCMFTVEICNNNTSN